MAFHFTLKGLLRLRQSLELAELQKLQAIAGAIARARAEIESVEKVIEERRRTFAELLAVGLTGAEWQFELARETSVRALLSELVKNLAHYQNGSQRLQVILSEFDSASPACFGLPSTRQMAS
jgi:flagellar biosynthesis chaperone FliJ